MLTQNLLLEEELIFIKNENKMLKEELAKVKSQLDFLSLHPTIAQGMQGETLIADLLGGTLTSYGAGHDLITKKGAKIEIKKAMLHYAKKENQDTRRWIWGKPFGLRGKKVYDYLVLVGEIDLRYKSSYLCPQDPYVIFLLHYDQVHEFAAPLENPKQILVSSNPKTVKKNKALFQYMISPSDLISFIGEIKEVKLA